MGLRTISAGIPYTMLAGIEAIGLLTAGLLRPGSVLGGSWGRYKWAWGFGVYKLSVGFSWGCLGFMGLGLGSSK